MRTVHAAMTHYMELLATNQPWNLILFMAIPVTARDEAQRITRPIPVGRSLRDRRASGPGRQPAGSHARPVVGDRVLLIG